MWFKEYRDYPIDAPVIKEPVEPGKGIVGCQMHEINGWGNTLDFSSKKKRKSRSRSFFSYLNKGM